MYEAAVASLLFTYTCLEVKASYWSCDVNNKYSEMIDFCKERICYACNLNSPYYLLTGLHNTIYFTMDT